MTSSKQKQQLPLSKHAVVNGAPKKKTGSKQTSKCEKRFDAQCGLGPIGMDWGPMSIFCLVLAGLSVLWFLPYTNHGLRHVGET